MRTWARRTGPPRSCCCPVRVCEASTVHSKGRKAKTVDFKPLALESAADSSAYSSPAGMPCFEAAPAPAQASTGCGWHSMTVVYPFRYKSSSISLFHQALTFRKRGRVRNIWKLQDEIARNLQREPSSKDLAEITKPASISSSLKHMAKEGIDLIVHVQSSCISALLLKAPRAPALPRGSPRHLDASALSSIAPMWQANRNFHDNKMHVVLRLCRRQVKLDQGCQCTSGKQTRTTAGSNLTMPQPNADGRGPLTLLSDSSSFMTCNCNLQLFSAMHESCFSTS